MSVEFLFYSCSLLCLEALDYEEILNLQGYELEDYMIEWTDWRIYLKDYTLIGLEIVSDDKIDRNVVIYVSITSNEKERMLELIDNKKLRCGKVTVKTKSLQKKWVYG